jgi:hypothetical protein
MSSRYIPGASNPYFQKHKYFGIPVNRNIQTISEVAVTSHSGPGGAVRKAVEVEILTAEHLWTTFQIEAEDTLKVNGRWITDDRERNRCINAAYAKLWLADNRFQWAGLAAFASKQVGCGLLHSADIIGKNRRERERIQRSFAQAAAPGVAYATLMEMGTEVGGSEMYQRLGFGNKHLFLDIYPLHRFYMERGWKEFDASLGKRENMRYAVEWQIGRNTLQFGKVFREVREGFGHIEVGALTKSVQSLARHEQINILQKILYDDWIMQRLLAYNQFAWANELPSGNYEEIKLTLTAECKTKAGLTALFSKSAWAKLWVADERMAFVLRAADQFDRLLKGSQRAQVEASIRAIADGAGVE